MPEESLISRVLAALARSQGQRVGQEPGDLAEALRLGLRGAGTFRPDPWAAYHPGSAGAGVTILPPVPSDAEEILAGVGELVGGLKKAGMGVGAAWEGRKRKRGPGPVIWERRDA